MKKVFIISTLLISSLAYSQTTPPIEWQRPTGGTEEDNITHAWADASGAIIMCGQSGSNDGDVSGNHGLWDGLFVKLDASGNLVWQKCYGGTAYDGIFSAKPTTDNGYIMAGYTSSNNGDVSGNHGGADAWIIKTDNWGVIQWKKCMGGVQSDVFDFVIQTSDGGYLVAGRSTSNNGDLTNNKGMLDGWMVKLDATGDLQWQKNYGGSKDDYIMQVLQTTDGNYIFTGYTVSSDGDLAANYGGTDAWIGKVNSTDGSLLWNYQYGGSGDDAMFALAMSIENNGKILTAGYTSSPNDYNVTGNHGGNDGWLLTIDEASGVLTSSMCLGGTNDDYISSIQSTFDKGFIMAAATASNNGNVSYSADITEGQLWAIKLNKALTIDWERTYGGPKNESGIDAFERSDGGYFFAADTWGSGGDVNGYHGVSGRDYWAVKLSNCFIPPVASAIVSADIPACGSLTNLSVPGGPSYTYQWYKDNTAIAGAFSRVYLTTAAGTYTCSVINGGCGTTNAPNSIINKKQKATIAPSGTVTKCAVDPVNFSANAGSGLSYQWYRGKKPIAGATGRTYSTTIAGKYKVLVSNANTQCTSFSKVTTVIVNSFSLPQNIELNEATASNKVLLINIPNPFQTRTVINYNIPVAYKTAQIRITDFAGKIIKQISLNGTAKGSIVFNSSGMAPSTYLYMLVADGQILKNEKLLVIQ